MSSERLREIRERLEGIVQDIDGTYDLGVGNNLALFLQAPSDIRWLLERVEELERERAVADAYEAGKKANDDIKNGRLRTFDSVDEMLASFNEPLEGGMDSND